MSLRPGRRHGARARAALAGLAACAAAWAAAAAPAPSASAEPTRRVAPGYPREAIGNNIEGCVTVSFEILPDGRADRYVVVDSVPQGLFDQATLLALNEWRFKVPERPGRYAQTIEYRFDGGRPAARECARPTFDQLNPPAAPRAEAPPAAQRQLRVLSRVMPAVERGGLPGCVTAQFVIHPDGRVGEIDIVDAKPGTRYVPATIAALKQWRFESFEPPALRGQQTFDFDPEQVRLPDHAVRAPFAVADKDGALKNEPCRTQPPANAETSKR